MHFHITLFYMMITLIFSLVYVMECLAEPLIMVVVRVSVILVYFSSNIKRMKGRKIG